MIRMELERRERGWSQCELSRRAGLTNSTINAMERGRANGYPSQLAKIAIALKWRSGPEKLLEQVEGEHDIKPPPTESSIKNDLTKIDQLENSREAWACIATDLWALLGSFCEELVEMDCLNYKTYEHTDGPTYVYDCGACVVCRARRIWK